MTATAAKAQAAAKHFYSPLSAAVAAFGMNEQLIANWLPASGVTAILSKRGDGKTLTLLDQALCFATDRDWLDQPTARGRTAIYCCAEDVSGTLQSALAWYQRAGIKPDDEQPRFLFVPDVPNLLDADECKLFIEAVRARLPANAKPVLYFDTWQRGTKGATMNDDMAMQTAMHNAEMIGRELGGPVCIACHPPKGNRDTIAGSMVIENETVAIWHMARPTRGGKVVGKKRDREIRVERIKGPGYDSAVYVRIEALEIGGKDQLGRPRTGAVLKPIDPPTAPEEGDDPGSDHVALDVLRGFGETGATWTEWWTAAEAQGMKRATFGGAIKRLVSGKLVVKDPDGKRYIAVDCLPEPPPHGFGKHLAAVPPVGHA